MFLPAYFTRVVLSPTSTLYEMCQKNYLRAISCLAQRALLLGPILSRILWRLSSRAFIKRTTPVESTTGGTSMSLGSVIGIIF